MNGDLPKRISGAFEYTQQVIVEDRSGEYDRRFKINGKIIKKRLFTYNKNH
jgi:hypothetical protein